MVVTTSRRSANQLLLRPLGRGQLAPWTSAFLKVTPTKTRVTRDAQAELREYRALQGELAPWTSAFLNKHARKPRLADVEGTGAALCAG